MKLLPILACLPLWACTSLGSPLVFQATVAGQGDVRSDGDATVIVGGLSGAAGVRFKGVPLPPASVFSLRRDEVWVRSKSRGVDRRQPVSEPLPSWCRALYTQADLDLLAALGIVLSFDPAQ